MVLYHMKNIDIYTIYMKRCITDKMTLCGTLYTKSKTV